MTRISSLLTLVMLGAGCASARLPKAPRPQASGPEAAPAPRLTPQPDGDWVAAPGTRKLPGDDSAGGKTYFRRRAETRSGTFRAMYESALDQRATLSGTFQTAEFRYTYLAPIGDDAGIEPRHDESITTVLLDCGDHFSGTRSIRYLLAGKLVKTLDTADENLLMMQDSAPSTVTDLCEFLATPP